MIEDTLLEKYPTLKEIIHENGMLTLRLDNGKVVIAKDVSHSQMPLGFEHFRLVESDIESGRTRYIRQKDNFNIIILSSKGYPEKSKLVNESKGNYKDSAVSIDYLIHNKNFLIERTENKKDLSIVVPVTDLNNLNNYLVKYIDEEPKLMRHILDYVIAFNSSDTIKHLIDGRKRKILKEGLYSKQGDFDKTIMQSLMVSMGDNVLQIDELFDSIITNMCPGYYNEDGVSDCSIACRAPINYRVGKDLESIDDNKVTPETLERLRDYIFTLTSRKKMNNYDEIGYMRFAYSKMGFGRFRITQSKQRGTAALSIRRLPDSFLPVSAFRLSKPIKEVLMSPRAGLYLITGKPNSGKSSLAATIINMISKESNYKILTLEDPIEYLFRHEGGIVNQMEIGEDIRSVPDAGMMALTADTDLIYVTEVRNAEELEFAIKYAQAGKKIIASMHGSSVYESLKYAMSLMPPESREHLIEGLFSSLRIMITQKLLVKSGGGLIPAHEIFNATQRVTAGQNLEVDLRSILSTQKNGCKLYDDDVFNMCGAGMISEKTFLEESVSGKGSKFLHENVQTVWEV